MRAAVVTRFDAPPSYGYFSEPVAGEGEVVIRVLAAPLSPIVKSLATGRHYSGTAEANFIPGIDGVGIDPDGKRVYFLFPKSPFFPNRHSVLWPIRFWYRHDQSFRFRKVWAMHGLLRS
ncbi:UNVERIFIED_ORG: hypothetical protein C7430_102113 [Pantoea agglomerans]|uniref:Uncharacterized protein n=1 Tax=Enterobacter agglomerans TaxID=549 RepID=A0ABD6XUB4_ENTAG